MYRRYQNRASWRGPQAALICAIAVCYRRRGGEARLFPRPLARSATGCRRPIWPTGAICLAAAERIWWGFRPGAAVGAGVSDIFREIEEELRRDNLLKLWRRYGKYVIAAAVLALAHCGPRRRLARSPGVAAPGRRRRATRRRWRWSARARTPRRPSCSANWRRTAAATACSRRSSRPSCWPRAATASGAVAAYDRLAAASDIDSGISRCRGAVVGHAVVPRRRCQDGDRAAAAVDRERQSLARQRARPDRRGEAQGGRSRAAPARSTKQLADDLAAPQALRARAAEMAAALKS